ncbi:hypothetical protein [Leptospira noguchii]|uniref:hypothetical protein n=1 Tax=Leptospira noguchii TaxID=28182 RepID=UPI001FB81B5D|nr:hypothetical protein [Leptospira noguchii]UOG29321.1 hypothetical protein MAL06_11500 [Leptospira noguchii]UOG53917.1 hypothetical protein MAL09_07410 [Leptospira noguchii]
MLRSVESSIEFEKFRRNWSENEQLSVSLLWSLDGSRAHFSYEIRERFAQTFLDRIHVN